MNLEINNKKNKKEEDANWENPVPEYDYCGSMGKEAIDYTHRVIINNRYFQIFIGVLFLVLFILIYGYFKLSNNLVALVKMPGYGEIKIAKMQSDPLYFKVWGDYVLSYFANFTSVNIRENIDRGLVVFDKDVLIEKKPAIEAYYQSIITNKITQNFKVRENKVEVKIEDSGHGATVLYPGEAIQEISDLATRKKDCFYEMHFFINNGEIIQDALKTNCLDDNSVVPKSSHEDKAKSKLIEEPNIDLVPDKKEDAYKIKIDNDSIMKDLKEKSFEQINKVEAPPETTYNKENALEQELKTKEKANYE
ncbi:hypothetical protein BKH42_03535 [Helicobacter sp. 13S00482-2]|uniref:TraE/TraK family type IV conjugative transfer system protein n=1 Tax=Helicobacter sp. 13S00482-2 TaxID=1476200 RepID=UPI000BDBE1DB|nr:TraE/TraK family type IV conjugative transfer system protein [Helicobacter sp. 13S00482-2]PAF53813.1 hypothetical protein BKH42_03535 [Helicobacter sp. 13S00482-2]